MPIYVFACPKGHVLDLIVPHGTIAQLCPACAATANSMDDLMLANRLLSRSHIPSETREAK